jgi:hypothetical protein
MKTFLALIQAVKTQERATLNLNDLQLREFPEQILEVQDLQRLAFAKNKITGLKM